MHNTPLPTSTAAEYNHTDFPVWMQTDILHFYSNCKCIDQKKVWGDSQDILHDECFCHYYTFTLLRIPSYPQNTQNESN